jgi:hypothetical protein
MSSQLHPSPTPFPLKDYRLAFSLCPLRSLRLCLDLLNRRGTRRAQIAAVKKRSLNSN